MRVLKKLGIVAGGLLVLVVALYFVATSGWFLKSVILPKAGKAVGARITVEDASLSPFSSVTLKGLKVQTTGAQPLLTVRELQARYSLMDIIGGRINVDEVSVVGPVVNVVMNADGTSNLDPFTQPKPGATPKKVEPSKPGGPPQVDVKKVTLKNGTVSVLQMAKGGSRTSLEVTSLNVSLDNLKNGGPARFTLEADLKYGSGAETNLSELAAQVKAGAAAELAADLKPRKAQADLGLNVLTATGGFADAAQLAARFNADLALDEIKQCALTFSKGGQALGAVSVSGPFDLLKQEGKLKLSVTGIGPQVLSLVGGRLGIGFGNTRLAAESDLEIGSNARLVSTVGKFTADKLSLTRSNLTTPVLDAQIGWDVTVDVPRTLATVRGFNLSTTQDGRPLLKGGLSREMTVDWSKGSEAAPESSLNVALTDLSLSDWKAFLGPNLAAGTVNSRLALTVQKAGRLIGCDLTTRLTGLAAQFGSNRIDQAGLDLTLRAQVADFAKVAIAENTLQVTRAGQELVSAKTSGQLDARTQDLDIQTDLSAGLARLAELAGRPDLSLQGGTLTFAGRLTQKNRTPDQAKNPVMDRTVTGLLQVASLTGAFQSNRFDRLQAAVDLDLAVNNNVADIRKCNGTLSQAGKPGGTFAVSGNVNLDTQAGQVAFKLKDLNQNTLVSFAAPLAPMFLTSVSVGADATARIDLKGDSGLAGAVQIDNLLITDPQGQLPKVPLSTSLKVDATLAANGVVAIKQFNAAVRQGDQPAGTFDVAGQFDLTNTIGQFTLKLADLNQNALNPFLAAKLGDKKLVSVSINAEASAKLEASGQAAAKADLNVANLLLQDPAGTLPKTPLAVRFLLDADKLKDVLNLHQAKLTLAPTDRAKNELALSGKVDMTRSNAITGGLKLAAESLDFTSYYDMFAASKPAAAPAAPPPPPPEPAAASAAPAPGQEPWLLKLPVENFTVDAEIGRLFLREVAINNLTLKTRLDGGKVEINPFRLTLNGAPVAAKTILNLGVPEYVYDVNLDADSIPVAPLVNTFQPERRGQMGGTVSASSQIKGAGTTGAALQKNLVGQFAFGATNLNLSVVNVQNRVLKTVVNVITSLPDLIRNPTAVLGSLLSKRSSSTNETKGGLMEDFTRAPINVIQVRGQAGDGRVDLQRGYVQSAAFEADAAGTITFAPILTNSALNIPVQVWLARPVAAKAGLAAGTDTNQPLVKLPQFVTVKGTLGEPKPDINYLALSGVAAKSATGIGGATGAALGEALGGLLGTKAAGAAPAVAPAAAPATPAAPSPSLKDTLFKPNTNTPPATNKSPFKLF